MPVPIGASSGSIALKNGENRMPCSADPAALVRPTAAVESGSDFPIPCKEQAMRKIPTVGPLTAGLLAASLLAGAAVAEDAVVRLSEPVSTTETYEDFGAVLPETGTVHSLGDAIAQLDDLAGASVMIETEIQQVCQKKGCFFIARDGESVARVRFQDYGFFIPTDSAGKTVRLAGTLERVALTPQQAAHFAEDLGKDADAAPMPEFEYQIMATAVRIPRA
jgi:hypothetical protein